MHLFISCAEAARRMSRSLDEPLSPGEKWGLRLHLAICRFCRRYLRQIRFLRNALRASPERLDMLVQEQLSDEAKERILRRLRDPNEGIRG